MKKLISITLFGFLLSTSLIQAQELKQLTKSEVLLIVAEQNNTLKISEQEYIKARSDYRQTNAVFLPNINASYSGIATTNPLMAFGSKLNQGILTAGEFQSVGTKQS